MKPVTVIRDYDRNAIPDFDNGSKETGNFRINIHRAESTGSTQIIDQSIPAGCQVFKDADDFYAFMQLCKLHAKYRRKLIQLYISRLDR
ncbi:MAG: hypothetical protein U0V64_16105 [Cyclobacteriaceae bacterium]